MTIKTVIIIPPGVIIYGPGEHLWRPPPAHKPSRGEVCLAWTTGRRQVSNIALSSTLANSTEGILWSRRYPTVARPDRRGPTNDRRPALRPVR
jgi:hypothetical protein